MKTINIVIKRLVIIATIELLICAASLGLCCIGQNLIAHTSPTKSDLLAYFLGAFTISLIRFCIKGRKIIAMPNPLRPAKEFINEEGLDYILLHLGVNIAEMNNAELLHLCYKFDLICPMSGNNPPIDTRYLIDELITAAIEKEHGLKKVS